MNDAVYQKDLLRLAAAAHGAGELDAPDAHVVRDNPLCGDRVTLDVSGDGGRITALAHKTRGCLLTQAAASVVARRAPGADAASLRALHAQVEALLRGEPVPEAPPEVAMFRPGQAVKSRHDCVLLPFRALEEALVKLDAKDR